MNHTEGVRLLREILVASSPQAAAALSRHEQDKVRQRERRARLQDPDRWRQADTAAAEAIENAALAQAMRELQRQAGREERERAGAEEKRRAESMARARARARRERAERDRLP